MQPPVEVRRPGKDNDKGRCASPTCKRCAFSRASSARRCASCSAVISLASSSSTSGPVPWLAACDVQHGRQDRCKQELRVRKQMIGLQPAASFMTMQVTTHKESGHTDVHWVCSAT